METLVNALATSRITRLVNKDQITAPLRKRVKETGNESLSYLVGCPACVSVYAAAAVLVLPKRLRVLLALSESVVLLRAGEGWLNRGSDDEPLNVESDTETTWGIEK